MSRILKNFVFSTTFLLLCGCITNNFNYPEKSNTTNKENTMQVAKGDFEVKMTPIGNSSALKLEKSYSGGLVAEATGEMLATRSATPGSASYVAIETVSGSLDGKQGSFVLVHTGVMQGESKSLTVNISPDSGTNELLGIEGRLEISIENGKHFYVLDYQIP